MKCVYDERRRMGLLDQGVSSSPYRTVLSVSRSQSLGGGREDEEEEQHEEEEEEEEGAVAGCWSTASSGTKARLSPLKATAGSGEQDTRRRTNKSWREDGEEQNL